MLGQVKKKQLDESQINDANGNPIEDKGKYIEIWRKQKDGKWKCTADIFNSDLSLVEEYWLEENNNQNIATNKR